MEMDNSTNEVPVESAAPEVPSEPQGDVQAPSEGQSAEAAPELPYNPDFKFKSLGQEYEIDEEYRGYIKTPEDEKRIKRMFEQYRGVDKLKSEWHEAKTKVQEYEPVVEKAKNYDMSFDAFNKLVNSGQYKKAFDLFGLPKDVMYKAALQYAEHDELPQQQKQVYDQLTEQEKMNAQLYEQFQSQQAQLQQLQSQNRSQELQSVLGNGDVRSVAEKYDQAYGAGSFRQQIINRGKQHYAATGEDLTAQQVAEDLVKLVKPFLSMPQAPTTQAVREVPVIPATGTSTASAPGEKQIKSLADLKAVRKEKFGY